MAVQRQEIIEAFERLPAAVRSAPAGELELAEFEEEFGSIPAAFRWFLVSLGGGPVGSEWLDDISALPQSHRKFSRECSEPGGWSAGKYFLIGWDGAGNPIGLDSAKRVVVEDHNFGGIHVLASSLEEFLSQGLLHHGH